MKIDYIGHKYIKTDSLYVHSHDIWEIVIINEGSGTLIADETEYFFKKDSIVCIPPKAVRYNTYRTDNVHSVILTSDFINPPRNEVIIFDDDSTKTIQNLFNIIMAQYYSSEPASNEIIPHLANALGMIMKEMIYAGYKFSDVEKVKNAMITNFANPDYTIGDAMENTNYSEAHFRKLFQEEMGMPPVKYLLELRLSSAAMQLKNRANSEMSIASIAAESGFNDQGYFARKFKEKYKVTPREYCTMCK